LAYQHGLEGIVIEAYQWPRRADSRTWLKIKCLNTEMSYVEWTPDGLLRHVVYLGQREDKLADEVRRSPPHFGET
jgi:ATP-dependent DNA ligase